MIYISRKIVELKRALFSISGQNEKMQADNEKPGFYRLSFIFRIILCFIIFVENFFLCKLINLLPGKR